MGTSSHAYTKNFIKKFLLVPNEVKLAVCTRYVVKCANLHEINFYKWRLMFKVNENPKDEEFKL